MKIHVALANAYPTEADARAAAISENPTAAHTPYLGIWTMPLPYGGTVHVFTHAPAERLEAAGWTRKAINAEEDR